MVDHRTHDDLRHMRRALELAASGPEADPNPRVGAVVLDSCGEVAGEGFHRGAGSPHAEVEALRNAGHRARGGTAYVSLEPCAHEGRTGPCTDALLDAGMARVVFAMRDPNPAASGGADRLRAVGVQVDGGLLAREALAVNRTWAHRIRTGRPFVTWKFAATLDGRSAAEDGTSQWITGEEARNDVHRLRARCGAIIVGTGTALTDDPGLTVRGLDAPLPRPPLRVVIGRTPLPPSAKLFSGEAPTRVFPHRDVGRALRQLAEDGIHHALLEGGPTLAASLLANGLVDEVVAYVAPALLGAGRAAVGSLGIHTIGGAVRLHPTSVSLFGGDVRIIAVPNHQKQETH